MGCSEVPFHVRPLDICNYCSYTLVIIITITKTWKVGFQNCSTCVHWYIIQVSIILRVDVLHYTLTYELPS